MKLRKAPSPEIVPATKKWGTNILFLIMILIMAGACSDDEGTSQPQTPNPGNIEVKIETDGKDDDPDGYVVLVDGVDLETDPNGTYVVGNKSPGTYSVELTGIPAHCEGEGEMLRQVVLAADGTIQVAYKVTCKAVLRNKILYAKGPRFFEEFGIFKMDLDGGNKELIYNQEISHATTIAVTPDGTTVYFTTRDFSSGEGKIHKMNAEGEEVEELFSGMYLTTISLSPDGTKLVFRMDLEGNIYLLDLGTQELNQITNEPELTFIGPSWNADGTKIVLTIQDIPVGNKVSIWEMNLDGSNLTQTLVDDDYWFSNAHLSPKDNKSIAFESTFQGEGRHRREIFFGNLESNERKNISAMIDLAINGNFAPKWSPDGNQILFRSQFQLINTQIYSYNIEKEELTQLTSEEALHLNAIFSPVMRP